jgi:5-methylcytosine-specific restriction endonuclease McrA
VGYSADELKAHLESHFTSKMGWKNYGSYWEIDHVIPQAQFEFTSMHDPGFKDCWALKNLRPLSCRKNRQDGGRLSGCRRRNKQ